MRIGSRPVPNVAEVLPAAALMHEVRHVPPALITEDSPELHEDIGGGIATPGSPSNAEHQYSVVLPVADFLHEERLVSTPMVTEESQMADEDIAGIVAAFANPIQMVKSLPDLQEPGQLTQASLDNAISPADASDPIHPAIIPRENIVVDKGEMVGKKRDRILLSTKADAGKFANIREAEEEVATTSSGNRPKNHFGQKNQRTGRVLSQFPDGLEGKSAEPELSKSHTVASASSSLAALSYRPSVPIINLPKPPPPFDLKVIHNNGSQKAVGYEFRAPPPGSYQDDDTGPSPKTLMMAVMGVKSAVNHFAEILIKDMNKHPVELEYLKQTIVREVNADIDRADHWKFLVQAFICKRLLDEFDAPNRCFGIDDSEMDRMSTNVSFADFFKFKDRKATISKLLNSGSPDGSFLGRFCFKKFKSINGYLYINQPLPPYQEEWSAVERECHPKTVFYQSFLEVAVSVWLLHRLVHSFEEKVKMLIYEKRAKFQRQTMESVVPGSYEKEDEEAGVSSEVGFLVIPGFQVSRSVVKCEVYLRSRNIPPYLEITGRPSTKKTLGKTPSNWPSGKTLSAKTSGTLHTPELPVRDSYSPGSLQPPKGFSNNPGSLQPFKGFNDSPGSLQPPKGFINNPGSLQPPKGFINNPGSLQPFKGFNDNPENLQTPKGFINNLGSLQPPKGFINNPGSLQPSKGFINSPGSLQPFKGFNDSLENLQPPKGFSNSPRSLQPFKSFNNSPRNLQTPKHFNDSPGNLQTPKHFNDNPGSLQPPKGFNNSPGSSQPSKSFNNIPGSYQAPTSFSNIPGSLHPQWLQQQPWQSEAS